MRFASLGSGSKGNATVVESGNTRLLIDCGFTIKETVRRMERLALSPDMLTAILVTHEHGDHLRGVMPLARKFQLPVYLTAGTAKASSVENPQISHISGGVRFHIGEIEVEPVSVPHDAREPVQYILRDAHYSLGVLTDLGSVTPHVVDCYRDLDGLLLEANHDLQMLASGPYPPMLKRRVGGQWGHLNNHQCADLLSQIELPKIQQLVLGHISLKNNSIGHVQQAVAGVVNGLDSVHYACQEQGFDWLCLRPPEF